MVEMIQGFDITLIVEGVIALVFAYVAKVLVGWIKSKLTKEQMDTMFEIADAVVMAVEQVLKATDGQLKKETAMQNVKEWLAKYNIVIDEQAIDVAIESAVKRLNIELKGE